MRRRGNGFQATPTPKSGVLTELTRDGLAQHRLAHRADALILLDRGMGYREVASVLLINDDTVRQWRQIFETEGVEGLAGFHFGCRHAFRSGAPEADLKA